MGAIANCVCKVFGDSAFKLSKTLLSTDTQIYFADPNNKLGNCGNYCAFVYFDGCLGGNGEVLKITNPVHSGVETYFTITNRAVDPNGCGGAYQAFQHTIQETAYIGDEKSFALYFNELVACVETNIPDCNFIRTCFSAGTNISIVDGVISSTVPPFSCADAVNCMVTRPVENVSSQKILGLNCSGGLVLADGFQNWKKTVSPLGTFFDTPGTAGWTTGTLGASGNFAIKTYAMGSFDISDLPVLCAGEHYEADIYTHLDFNYADPNTPLPGPTDAWGYNSIQILVNGQPGYNGTNLSGGNWFMGTTGGYYGPTPHITSRFVLNYGINNLDLSVGISGKSRTGGVNVVNRPHKLLQNQVQIMVYKVKD